MISCDLHSHTSLCGHAVGTPELYVHRAVDLGLRALAITCHVPSDRPDFGGPGIRMRRADLPVYRDWVERARSAAAPHGLEILYGIEAEITDDLAFLREQDEILAAEPFDFVLGSLHHQLPIFRQRLLRDDLAGLDLDIIRRYFAQLTAGVRQGTYDSIAHPDVIRCYGTVERFVPAELESIVRPFLEAAASADVCLEVNTSGLTKEAFEIHPDPLFLQWARETGNRLTIGSDAHRPASVGQCFDDAERILTAAGFDTLHLFRQRHRQAVPLAEAKAD